MQNIQYRQKRWVRSGLGRQLQAASLGLPLMAAWSRIISEKVIVTEIVKKTPTIWNPKLNPLNAKLNPICHLLSLLGAHPIFHVSRRLHDPALYPVLIHINSFHIITAHFPHILFNIMHPFAPKYSREHISVGYFTNILYQLLIPFILQFCPSRVPDLILQCISISVNIS